MPYWIYTTLHQNRMFDASRTIAFEEVRGKLEKLFSEISLEDLELIWKDKGQIFL